MKTYEALYEPEKNKGVYGISLVENPAMEGLFIALNKQSEIQFKEVDKEQRILTGLALEPNKPIYRNQNGEEFNIVFSEDTIKDLAFGFLKNGYQKNSSLEHDNKITGVTFTESWIIKDSKNDKANALGFNYPDGSWMVTMKVDDDAIWNDYVKTGKVQGFSIDAMLSLKEVNLKSEIKMSENNSIAEAITKGFNDFFASFKKEPEIKLEFGNIKTSDGNVDIMFEGDMMEIGGRVWILAEDGTEVALPVGEYELEDGRILVVAEEGTIAEVKDAAAPAEAQPAAMNENPTESVGDANAVAQAVEKAVKSIMIKYSEENVKQIEAIKAELKADYDAQILKLSEQPAANPIRSTPVQVDLSKMTKQERILTAIRNNQ